MSEPTEFEQMADLAHYMWANWMRYMFTCGTFNDDGTWTMNAAEASRWQHQMNTPYSKLTPEEQVSDGNIAAEWINQYRVVYKVRQEHAQLAAAVAERDAARDLAVALYKVGEFMDYHLAANAVKCLACGVSHPPLGFEHKPDCPLLAVKALVAAADAALADGEADGR